ncbi:ComF family protein [Vibrio sp. SCSIO 43135]|uniref:ComF family protein n=1 Tax=Vibrio sp. SCSIO 43135 TaxID=2819096 RepID=UPI002075F178|nr:phosphoribosyltransferase family protein [Vibrio sp. SCSIO 43135]USD41231.1 ComF family protein [Vibrio sp. SCSIO 43135]
MINTTSPNSLATMLSDWLQKTMHQYCSPVCDLCRLPLAPKQEFSIWCSSCQSYFQSTSRCQRCGLPTVTSTPMCGSCLTAPPLWSRLYCVGDYQAPLSNYISKLKYQRQFWHARNLAPLLTEKIDTKPEILTSVPMHWRRKWWRGFNHSEILAAEVAKLTGITYQHNVFKRCRPTKQQQGLNKSQRLSNLRGAFRLSSPPLAKHVAIIDDVVTTGSTVHHLCKLLLEAGVETIDIYCICRTPEPTDSH